MNYTENFEGIKIDVQAVDITIDNNLQQSIRDVITRLRRHISDVNFVDVYITVKSPQILNRLVSGLEFRVTMLMLLIRVTTGWPYLKRWKKNCAGNLKKGKKND